MHPIHLCIGAPRAGTTWLFREMRQHPSIFLPVVKEVRFWNSRRSDVQRDAAVSNARKQAEAGHDSADQSRWLDDWSKISRNDPITIETYRDLMAVKDRPSLDISPAYCFLPLAKVKELRDGLPKGSKVFYHMRDPMQRLSSQIKLHFHLQGTYRGRPSHDDLAQFLNNSLQQKRWDYATVLNNWGSVFGDDFITLSFDDAVRDPKAFTYHIAKLLEIDLAPQTATRGADDFKHSDQNHNNPRWVPSLGPREKKLMAQAMEPAITTFAALKPKLGAPWLSRLRQAVETKITDPEPIYDIDLPTQKLMRMTESLGDNCEYGFWQRHRAYEPSSLFRWAITPANSLLAFLEAPAPLYAATELSVHSPSMVKESRFGFKFDSKLVERAEDNTLRLLTDTNAFKEIHADEAANINHLRATFFIQVKRRACLYIIKGNEGMGEGLARAVLMQLHRHNPQHHLLWVEADGAPALTDLGSGLLRGSLPAFAPHITADAYAEGGWTSLMTQASRLEPIAQQIATMQR